MSNFFQKVEDFFTNEVWPDLKNFFTAAEEDVVAALTPIMSSVVAQETTALAQSAGNLTAFAAASGKILSAAATQAEAAGVTATGAALLQSFTNVIAQIQPTANVSVSATIPVPAPAVAPPQGQS